MPLVLLKWKLSVNASHLDLAWCKEISHLSQLLHDLPLLGNDQTFALSSTKHTNKEVQWNPVSAPVALQNYAGRHMAKD